MASGTHVERLAAYLLADATDGHLAAELGTWLGSSSRFRAFADAHRDKIRKKLLEGLLVCIL